jgi:hypothetical protein
MKELTELNHETASPLLAFVDKITLYVTELLSKDLPLAMART